MYVPEIVVGQAKILLIIKAELQIIKFNFISMDMLSIFLINLSMLGQTHRAKT